MNHHVPVLTAGAPGRPRRTEQTVSRGANPAEALPLPGITGIDQLTTAARHAELPARVVTPDRRDHGWGIDR
jgi:hypothetical protein